MAGSSSTTLLLRSRSLFRGDPDSSWRPVKTWERDPATGRNRPTNVQADLDGIPLWEMEVAAAVLAFGEVRREWVTIQVASPERPDVALLGQMPVAGGFDA